MCRGLSFLVLILICAIGGTEIRRAPASDLDRPGQLEHLRSVISPASKGDCALSQSTLFLAHSDRVADRDENENEDDFREVSELPRTFERLQALISRTVPRLSPSTSSALAPCWRTPLLC